MRIVLFADMHIGAIKDIDYYYKTMTDIIDKEICFVKTDALIILGDYFDRLFKVNEEYVSLAINLMSYITRMCSKTNTKIRIVYGTESHEMNQYRLFNHHITSNRIDMKVIYTCQEEELFPNVNVLYVPEEYISNKYEFYKNTLYSGKKYKYIFGHGVITEGMPEMVSIGRKSNDNNIENKVPHFNMGELSKASELTIFGHYHVHWNKENVSYLGSLFRSSFGEETSKYYGVIEDDNLKLIENTNAYIYKTYEFDESSDVYENGENLMRVVTRIKNENQELFNGTKIGKIRLKFNAPADLNPSFKENLKSILVNDKILSSLIKEKLELTKEDIEKEEENDEFEFVLDNGINVNEKIYSYLTKTCEDVMTLDELVKYITEPLSI